MSAELRDALVLGLTGSFGSGCSTLAEALRVNHGFEVFSLSTLLKREFEERLRTTGEEGREPTRAELQDLGNELRQSKGRDFLARSTIQEAEQQRNADRLAFDSIKNLAEVKFLRDSFPNFFLVQVQCSSDKRWNRVEARYRRQGLGREDIEKDDIRDQVEFDLPYGQQVQLCADEADIVIANEKHCHSRPEAVRTIEERADQYVGLVTKDSLRYPAVDEVMMSVAYMQATLSRCIKRQVGAVIVDDRDTIVSAAFNDNPPPIQPCQLRLRCEKDSKMLGKLEALEGSPCPRCGQKLAAMAAPYVCSECEVSLKEILFPDRGMQWCTAIHAEDGAIRHVGGRNLQGCTLYTTTFPCFNCAKAITYAGIQRIVYVEPYPDGDGAALLETAKKEVLLFEGVKARAFHRLFAPIQAEMERRYGMGI